MQVDIAVMFPPHHQFQINSKCPFFDTLMILSTMSECCIRVAFKIAWIRGRSRFRSYPRRRVGGDCGEDWWISQSQNGGHDRRQYGRQWRGEGKSMYLLPGNCLRNNSRRKPKLDLRD